MNLFGTQPALGYRFLDADGAPLANGTVLTKLAGLSTQVATFADAALSTPNANPLTLDGSGRAVMFLSPTNGTTTAVAYDVFVYDADGNLVSTYEDVSVPAPSNSANLTNAVVGFGAAQALTIAGGAITPTKNTVIVSPEGGAADNLDTINVTGIPDGAAVIISNASGSAPITVRHNQGNIFTPDGQNIILTTTAQRNIFIRNGANLYLVGSASTPTIGNGVVNGRLTVTSGTPINSGSASGSTIYFTPYLGNTIDLYDGSAGWDRLTFSELSIAVPNVANKVYDVFAYNNGGTVTLELGAQWTNATTRATGLVMQDGIYVKSGTPTRRYLGTFATLAASGTVYDGLTARCLWNYYNRVRKACYVVETTPTWSYNAADYRQARATVTNQIAVVQGVSEDSVELTVQGLAVVTDAGDRCYVSIGTDTVSLLPLTTGIVGQTSGQSALGSMVTPTARLVIPAVAGLQTYLWLERGEAGGAVTWFGTGASSSREQAGMSGHIFG